MTLPTSSKVWSLKRFVEDNVIVDGPDSHFELATRPLAPLDPDSILVQVLALSNDPVQLIRLRADQSGGNIVPMDRTAPIRAWGIGRVLALGANVTSAKVGDLVFDHLAWAEYFVLKPGPAMRVVNGGRPLEFPLSTYLGILGFSGLTAYAGLKGVLNFQPGQSIVVSGAAGSVGHVVVQYAKNVLGASRVIAIAGSDEKCAWLEKHGADTAVNYKSPNFSKELAEVAGGEGFDAFFDNVYGPVYHTVLPHLKIHGKVAVCGAISQYNSKKTAPIQDSHHVLLFRALSVIAFTCFDYLQEFSTFERDMTDAIKAGKVSIGEGTETVVDLRNRFEDIPKTWEGLYHGANSGKLVSIIAD